MGNTMKVGYTTGGSVLYRLTPGFVSTCSECGRTIIDTAELFTTTGKRRPICRKCRPFMIDEKESRKLLEPSNSCQAA